MIPGRRETWIKGLLINFGLALLGSLLFAAAFPNPFVEKGLPLLAWVAYVPVFVLIRRASLGASFFWGALYGYAAYGLFNYWLAAFHPLAGLIVGLVYLVYLGLLFFLLKLALIFFPRRAYLVQWVFWLAYEYLKTKGFLGYSYGITGYSQWAQIPLIQIAGLFGVWGVSALTVFSSAWLAQALWPDSQAPAGGIAGFARALRAFFLKDKIPPLLWAGALGAALIYGFFPPPDFSTYPSARLALVQHNTDPWKGAGAPDPIKEYRADFQVLRRLSGEALREDPKPDLVVWSETAFIPRIYWHANYRGDPPSWNLVKELLDYLSLQEVPFLIGNDDARKDPAKNPDPREDYRIDYNGALLFEQGNLTALYRKLHLVPFTEYFPYKKQLPRIHKALKEADTHFWEKGEEAVVFSLPGFKFSTPICFEDAFGYLSREFVRRGAELIVNISNDAWSKSLSAQNQHLAMSVFRAVENRRSVARSTASGQTCGIDPAGRILAMAPPFSESWITVELPVMTHITPYTRYGDYLAWIFTAAAFTLLIAGLVSRIIKTKKK
ncbi:MAG: apolipoprotein N-acyltransferase [Treponema sp.]|jgi:apolipoprotein N-acyltransferase|nr:apolipoprotein N-acyltransferase [Treponema sp.]